jgi:hypothetical protein
MCFILETGHGNDMQACRRGARRHESGEPASMLILFAPGAPREGFFEALAEIAAAGRRPSDEEMAALYPRHDTYPV